MLLVDLMLIAIIYLTFKNFIDYIDVYMQIFFFFCLAAKGEFYTSLAQF